MRVASEVLTVLSTLTIDGSHVTMPKLDRKLYLAVDKVLQACGVEAP